MYFCLIISDIMSSNMHLQLKDRLFISTIVCSWVHACGSESLIRCNNKNNHLYLNCTLQSLDKKKCFTNAVNLTLFCQGVYQRSRCYRTPQRVPLSSLEQLMTKKVWHQNGCLSGMEVSHHPWQPGQAHGVSSVRATKPGIRVHLTSWPLCGIDLLQWK